MTGDILLVLIVDIFLGCLFLAGAFQKLSSMSAFTVTVGNYRLAPALLSEPVAVLILLAEFILGMAALVGLWLGTQAGLAGLGILLSIYAAAIATNIIRGNHAIDCGCSFGQTGSPISWALVLRNCLLATIAFISAALPLEQRQLQVIDWISLTGALGTFALLYYGAGLFPALDQTKGSGR
jgi:hypothetical protein